MGLRVQICEDFLYNAQDGLAHKWVALYKNGVREYREVPLRLSLCQNPLGIMCGIVEVSKIKTLDFPLAAQEYILLGYGFRPIVSFAPDTNVVTMNKGTPNSITFPW
jgi:hypothetical protein